MIVTDPSGLRVDSTSFMITRCGGVLESGSEEWVLPEASAGNVGCEFAGGVLVPRPRDTSIEP